MQALWGRREQRIRDLAHQYDVPNAYTDEQALVHDPTVDAIVIATPNALHYRTLHAAAAAEIDASLADLHRDLFVESNPIPVKWALERMGRIPGGIRLPLTRLGPNHESVVEAALAKAGLL